ncbi:hypothetical protein STEG23_029332, partial [Scotinomys teguina]
MVACRKRGNKHLIGMFANQCIKGTIPTAVGWASEGVNMTSSDDATHNSAIHDSSDHFFLVKSPAMLQFSMERLTSGHGFPHHHGRHVGFVQWGIELIDLVLVLLSSNQVTEEEKPRFDTKILQVNSVLPMFFA